MKLHGSELSSSTCVFASRRTLSSYTKRKLPFRSRTRIRCIVRNEQKKDVEEVYVGDGKVIVDDPRKYPSKEDAGLMQGATGGWAGGEPGLQKFLETIGTDKIDNSNPVKERDSSPKKLGKGGDKIYVGFDYKNSEDMDARNRGEQGNFVIDDENKYPSRDYIGWFPLQGGFAGGEIGLQKFLNDGDIEIRSPGQEGGSQMSPVVVGIFIAAVATTGGLLLTDAIDFGEGLLSLKVDQSPLDEKTKLLLEAAVVLLAFTWAGSLLLAFFRTIKEKLDASASALQKVSVSLAFWIVVVYATYNLAKS